MTKNKRKKILYSILMFIFIGISGLSIFFLLKYYVDIKKSEDKFKDLKNMIIMEEFDNNSNSNNTSEVDNSDIHLIDVNGILIQKKYKNIFELNTDFIGWIKIKNTNIERYGVEMPFQSKEIQQKSKEAGYEIGLKKATEILHDIINPK